MSIDTQEEQLLSLKEAANAVPSIDGKKPHSSSLWRWIHRGLSGIHLEHVKVGRRVCTSREAINRFVNALAEKESSELIRTPPTSSSNPKSTKRRQAQIQSAEKTLLKAGFKVQS